MTTMTMTKMIAGGKEEAFVVSKKQLRIATITDTHIGESCGGDLSYEGCKPVRALTAAVNKCNELKFNAVFITGDITSSALMEEFLKAKEILSALQMPWFPVLGENKLN